MNKLSKRLLALALAALLCCGTALSANALSLFGGRIYIQAAGDEVIDMLADQQPGDFSSRAAEISAKFKALDTESHTTGSIFATTPSLSAPYAAGSLQTAYLNNALNTLNLTRYLSGLPNVTRSATYDSYCQHGAVLLYASEFDHSPPRPADMTTSFYNTALRGTEEANIGAAYSSGTNHYQALYYTIAHGFLADDDSDNLPILGHRRWALNPKMASTGFGQAAKTTAGAKFPSESYSSMYAMDQSAASLSYEAIGYPSGKAFPSNVFLQSYPWSISLNPDIYAAPNINDVTVTLIGNGKTISFSKANTNMDKSYDYFNINTQSYGVNNCIVFRPSHTTKTVNGLEVADPYPAGTYTVTVNGLKLKNGSAAALTYRVTFFDALDEPANWPTPEEPAPGVPAWNGTTASVPLNNGSYTLPLDGSATWSSSNTTVATVASGVVTLKARGTTVISARINETTTYSCTIVVTDPVVAPPAWHNTTVEIPFQKNGSHRLNLDAAATWSSSNTAVATVNQTTGELTIKNKGTTTITANVGGTNYSCTVNVKFSFFQWIAYILLFGWIWMVVK
ncbi:MAG: Ig-like domain-containing protein [Oscillospiraceae bacterium]|nr:Ig-like domain-containing protein [Oscillospiraceae bacterium]